MPSRCQQNLQAAVSIGIFRHVPGSNRKRKCRMEDLFQHASESYNDNNIARCSMPYIPFLFEGFQSFCVGDLYIDVKVEFAC